MWHVSSSRNRASIEQFGLDWTRMGAARGIAGSTRPENDGIFLGVDRHEADYFVRMNNTGGPVDVWEVRGVDPDDLLDNGSGYGYLPAVIDRDRLTLVRTDVAPVEPEPDDESTSDAYASALTITFDDGTTPTDPDVSVQPRA